MQNYTIIWDYLGWELKDKEIIKEFTIWRWNAFQTAVYNWNSEIKELLKDSPQLNFLWNKLQQQKFLHSNFDKHQMMRIELELSQNYKRIWKKFPERIEDDGSVESWCDLYLYVLLCYKEDQIKSDDLNPMISHLANAIDNFRSWIKANKEAWNFDNEKLQERLYHCYVLWAKIFEEYEFFEDAKVLYKKANIQLERLSYDTRVDEVVIKYLDACCEWYEWFNVDASLKMDEVLKSIGSLWEEKWVIQRESWNPIKKVDNSKKQLIFSQLPVDTRRIVHLQYEVTLTQMIVQLWVASITNKDFLHIKESIDWYKGMMMKNKMFSYSVKDSLWYLLPKLLHFAEWWYYHLWWKKDLAEESFSYIPKDERCNLYDQSQNVMRWRSVSFNPYAQPIQPKVITMVPKI